MRGAFTVTALLLVSGAFAQAPAACNESCQAQQNLALLELYNATNGPTWAAPSKLTVRGQSGNDWGSSTPGADASLPPFCGWAGARSYLHHELSTVEAFDTSSVHTLIEAWRGVISPSNHAI